MFDIDLAHHTRILFISVGVFVGIVILLVVLVFLFRSCIAHAIGNAVKAGIQNYDTHYLGCNVTIDDLVVFPARGILLIKGLNVKNPPGYATGHLMTAKEAKADLNMMPIMASRMKHIAISEIILKGIDVIFEKKGMTSNVQDVVAHLQGKRKPSKLQQRLKKAVRQCDNTCCGARHKDKDEMKPLVSGEASENDDEDATPAEPEQKKLTLRKVMLEDISLLVVAHMFPGHGAYVSVADKSFEDFDKEIGVSEVLSLVGKTMIKSVIADVIGHKRAEALM